MGNQAGRKGKDLRNERTEGAPGEPGQGKDGKKRKEKRTRLSSEMLKRKRTKGSESQAPIPEERSEREAPVERLWERSREGRKETNRKLSKRNLK